MVDTKELKKAMKKNGYTIELLAKEIGRSRTGLFNKIHNLSEFRAKEIEQIAILLKLKKTDMNRIFFAHKVE